MTLFDVNILQGWSFWQKEKKRCGKTPRSCE